MSFIRKIKVLAECGCKNKVIEKPAESHHNKQGLGMEDAVDSFTHFLLTNAQLKAGLVSYVTKHKLDSKDIAQKLITLGNELNGIDSLTKI